MNTISYIYRSFSAVDLVRLGLAFMLALLPVLSDLMDVSVAQAATQTDIIGPPTIA
jgi:hypothetical protein